MMQIEICTDTQMEKFQKHEKSRQFKESSLKFQKSSVKPK